MFGGLNVKPMREHKTLQLQHKVFSIQMIIKNIKHYHWFFIIIQIFYKSYD